MMMESVLLRIAIENRLFVASPIEMRGNLTIMAETLH